ncbi:MAG: M3 family oligoendopeptidase [Kiloniellales bacterium]|nr:M3 family oligoendopeptidase [Kiloniellales bacterium]
MKDAVADQVNKDFDLGPLPAWDLSDLYPSSDGPELSGDLQQAEADAKAFQARFQGKLKSLSGVGLAEAISFYEEIDERLSRLLSYGQLLYSADMSDAEVGRFFQSLREDTTRISSLLLFFPLELNALEDEELERKLKSKELRRYAPWIADQRVMRPHQLSEEQERLLHEKYVTGRGAWNRLFDETMAGLRFPFRGKDLTSAELLNLLSDADGGKRKEAAKSFGKVLGDNERIFALITNTLAKDKAIEDSWRGFSRPVSPRNLANLVEDDVVDALVDAVRESYGALSHRYYRLKAGWFASESIPYWDRNAPLPEAAEEKISWLEAEQTVLRAYRDFSPKLADVGESFFKNDWIDAAVRPGKAPGAFAHPTVPSAHPYLLLNYQGKLRDVMTLAHELGHGCHQVLAGGQGHLLSQTPLTLAETASVFGEMLTFRSLLKRQEDPKTRKIMLAGKVEDMLNTVVRQIAFHSFETKLHEERRQGELLPERIGEIWLETQKESLGPGIRFEEEYRHYWSYIPHFIHVPFYVYAYAFGDCLVNSLYAVYEDSEEGFAERYLELLTSGGSKRHKALLAPFGLDASDPEFWKRGLSLISRFIDELAELD